MTRSLTLGVTLSQAALCIVLIASTVDAFRAQARLSATLTEQGRNDDLIGRIDHQLDALARGTQALAQQGNANAARVVAELARTGVHINAANRR